MSRRITTEQFVACSRKIHGETYDYSRTSYIAAKKKVEITCRKHGIFSVTPDNHIRRHSGCPLCASRRRGEINSRKLRGRHHNNFSSSLSKRFADFLAKSRIVHGDRYDYSLVKYKSKRAVIELICSKHGKFETLPGRHMRGSGCPVCARENRRKNQDEFIRDAILIHGGKYDYSRVSYWNCKTKVIIGCLIHGEFLQSPNKHLCGHGCSRCRESHGERAIAKWLDFHGIKHEREKLFDGCVNPFTGKNLRFDFYIPNRNMCIEFDGEQHSVIRTQGIFAGTIEKIRKRDEMKDNFCSVSGIRLLRVRHSDFQNLDRILKRELVYVN